MNYYRWSRHRPCMVMEFLLTSNSVEGGYVICAIYDTTWTLP